MKSTGAVDHSNIHLERSISSNKKPKSSDVSDYCRKITITALLGFAATTLLLLAPAMRGIAQAKSKDDEVNHASSVVYTAESIASAKRESDLYYADGLKKWTPEDSVRLSYFAYEGDTLSMRWNHEPTRKYRQLLTASPDGKYFFVVSRHGDLERDDNVYELKLWETAAVTRALESSAGEAPVPLRILRHRSTSSSSDFAALAKPRFVDGGAALLYVGADTNGVRNLYRLDLASGRIDQLTHRKVDVIDYVERGGTVIFASHAGSEPPVLSPLSYPVQPVERVGGGQAGGSVVDRFEYQARTWAKDRRVYAFMPGKSAIELSGMPWQLFGAEERISPDGRSVIFAQLVEHWLGDPLLRPSRFIRVDLATGTRTELAAGQVHWPRAIWSPDGRNALLTGAKPIDSSSTSKFGAIAVIAATGKRQDVADYYTDNDHYSVVRWLSASAFVVVENWRNAQSTETLHEFRNGAWIARAPRPAEPSQQSEAAASGPTALGGGLTVAFAEGPNEPPVLIASANGRSVALTVPDPLLNQVWWGQAQPFSWVEDGKEMSGMGLLRMPREHKPGTQIPVAIMVGFAETDRFYPDGVFGGAATDTVQSLLARGIGVLEFQGFTGLDVGTVKEPHQILTRIEAVTAALIKLGVADPARLGIAGFSRHGYFTNIAITHPSRYPFAAAIADDSYAGLYAHYVTGWADGQTYGGRFWENKDEWLAMAPDFNADRVGTPVMFTQHTGSMVAGYPLSPALRNNYHATIISQVGIYDLVRRPIEYLVFPDGDHGLQRPREVVALQEAVIDWMCFWLRGEVPPDPERAERWMRLRKQQDEVIKGLTQGE